MYDGELQPLVIGAMFLTFSSGLLWIKAVIGVLLFVTFSYVLLWIKAIYHIF